MNKGPGGKQPKMRDTVWNGQPQTMTLPDGRPKGAALVLGYNTRGMKLEEMRAILADHDDFKNEKCRVDTFLSNSGHTCVFIPKFHCELNPIERVWSQSKRYPSHCLTSTKHSSAAEERYEGELCASMQELYVCVSGGICSQT